MLCYCLKFLLFLIVFAGLTELYVFEEHRPLIWGLILHALLIIMVVKNTNKPSK